MQQIADWLKKLGMPEYAERFAENDIDVTVLPDLTDQHLKDLGVSLGHRLKMLRAIRDLSSASVAVTIVIVVLNCIETSEHPTEENNIDDRAEPRPIPVMAGCPNGTPVR